MRLRTWNWSGLTKLPKQPKGWLHQPVQAVIGLGVLKQLYQLFHVVCSAQGYRSRRNDALSFVFLDDYGSTVSYKRSNDGKHEIRASTRGVHQQSNRLQTLYVRTIRERLQVTIVKEYCSGQHEIERRL